MAQKSQVRSVLGMFFGLVLVLASSVVWVGHAQQPAAPPAGAQPPAVNLFTGKTESLPTEGVATMGRRSFEATARSGWQRHAGGQLVLCEKGRGLYQERGKPARVLNVGDSAFIRAGVEHWHGAVPNESFMMLYVSYSSDVALPPAPPMQRVTDEEYSKATAALK